MSGCWKNARHHLGTPLPIHSPSVKMCPGWKKFKRRARTGREDPKTRMLRKQAKASRQKNRKKRP